MGLLYSRLKAGLGTWGESTLSEREKVRMTQLKNATKVLILSLVVIQSSCARLYTYEPPLQTDDGWETADLSDIRIDARPLKKLVKQIRHKKIENVHSILIARDGKLAFEEYFPGYRFDPQGDQFHGEFEEFDADAWHNLASVTKAFTGALVGIAIDRGDVSGIDQRVFDFFPEYARLKDEKKEQITIEHLLTMSSGLEWNEMDVSIATLNNEHDLIQLWQAKDPIEYILSKPVVAEPGTRWYYSGGDVNVLGEVLKKATGMRMDRFAEKYLFEPMGIEQYEWLFLKPEVVYASGDLKLRPRDMLKFGQMHLDGGAWNGKRISSREWVEAATSPHQRIENEAWRRDQGDHYGYHWFLRAFNIDGREFPCYVRTGWGGQTIAVFPRQKTVVVLTGGNYVTPNRRNEILTRYILPAIR